MEYRHSNTFALVKSFPGRTIPDGPDDTTAFFHHLKSQCVALLGQPPPEHEGLSMSVSAMLQAAAPAEQASLSSRDRTPRQSRWVVYRTVDLLVAVFCVSVSWNRNWWTCLCKSWCVCVECGGSLYFLWILGELVFVFRFVFIFRLFLNSLVLEPRHERLIIFWNCVPLSLFLCYATNVKCFTYICIISSYHSSFVLLQRLRSPKWNTDSNRRE